MKPDQFKKDEFHKKAQEDGFRARSAFKIIQIHEQFNIFHNAKAILDLGCAPGSWLQAILDLTKDRKIKLMGVDLTRITPIEDVKLLKMDVFSEKLEEEIENYFVDGIDVIVSDMAPHTSGNKTLDSGRSIDLVQRAFSLADNFLKVGGNVVTKVFQSQDMNEFVRKIKAKYEFVQTHKPKASRQGNWELYIIAKGKKKNNE
jgi:23S rRNA (uridine2552-2'-O)-methyltransferase